MSTHRQPPGPRNADAPRDRVRVTRETTHEPRLPHDRDESADSQQQPAPDPMLDKAYEDVEAGRVDTDRGPVLEELGRRLPSHATPKPAKKRPTRR